MRQFDHSGARVNLGVQKFFHIGVVLCMGAKIHFKESESGKNKICDQNHV